MKIIRKPIITEKTMKNYKDNNVVVFEVDVKANKKDATKILEDVYGVKVLAARVINRLGKYKSERARRKINKQSDKKIMIFKLAEKDQIDIFKS